MPPPLLVTDSPYEFVPPHEGPVWPRLLARITPQILRQKSDVIRMEVRGSESIRNLLREGHGVLLAPNHCRMPDALVLQSLAAELRQPFYIMASAHLFRGAKFIAFLLRRLGCFSVYREGIDRQAVQKAVELLSEAQRPLVIFPEGALNLANDRLNPLMEGVPFIARAAAKKAKKQGDGRKVFVVPVALRYLFQGDLEETVAPILSDIERRLTWQPQQHLSLIDRIYRVGPALLTLKELEYLGEPQTGELDERITRLLNHILAPLEEEWFDEPQTGSVTNRVKNLRKAVLPNMIESELDEVELDRRWRQLRAMELAQQLSLYPPSYVASKPSVDRILETVERFQEHLSGEARPHPPRSAVIQVGTPIEVSPKRDRSANQDPVLTAIEKDLTSMLGSLSEECAMYAPGGSEVRVTSDE